MYFSYNTQLQNRPPVTPQMRADALGGLMAAAAPRGQYGSQYGDVLRSLGQQNAFAYNRAADQANMAYAIDQREAAQDLSARGLQYLTADAGRQRKLQNSRLDLMRSALGAYR